MKKRPLAHVIDSRGEDLLRRMLPDEWVIRGYKPDYGIDFAVEIFDARSSGDTISLGEQFFIQLKSKANVSRTSRRVYARHNVEKVDGSTFDRSQWSDIAVTGVSIDADELKLARSMGSVVPLLLIVADLEAAQLYWVCLNDFVDKIWLPERSARAQATYTVHIPISNMVDGSERSLMPLRFLARRAKLYGAFNRFRYQRHELDYAMDDSDVAPSSDSLKLVKRFVEISLSYDFWKDTSAWPAIEIAHSKLKSIARILERVEAGEKIEALFPIRSSEKRSPEEIAHMATFLFRSEIAGTFEVLSNLGNVYEEVCREWFLPTLLGDLFERTAIE